VLVIKVRKPDFALFRRRTRSPKSWSSLILLISLASACCAAAGGTVALSQSSRASDTVGNVLDATGSETAAFIIVASGATKKNARKAASGAISAIDLI